jgi:hypothetical protein
LGDNDALLLTIDGASVRNFARNYLNTDDQKVVLTFKEFGDAEYVLNQTSYSRLAARYGTVDPRRPVFGAWLGQVCVLVATETDNPQQPGARVRSLWVAGPGQWSEAVKSSAPVETAPRTRGKRASR